MVGSIGERMLAVTVPHVDAWNAWYGWTGNRPEGVRPLREKVDAAAAAAGREPSEIERTVAVLVRLPGASGGREYDAPPLEGAPEIIAEGLRAYAGQGIGHIQLVIDPITEASIEALGPVLEILGGGR
jgi:alkanesulfonate monooxygenase SsuD/methylene tetrahydromethanopterin reductase-like flavin-dependent oxidoreductase (luciferase family)